MISDLLTEAEHKMDQATDHVGLGVLNSPDRAGQSPAPPADQPSSTTGRRPPFSNWHPSLFPSPGLLVVQPFDKSTVGDIERAMQTSELGLNPTNDGNVIRIAFPPLTEERRRDLIKVVKHMAEEGRVAVRNIRRHSKADMEAMHGEISDDDIRRGEEELQKLTDRYVEKIDRLLAHKEEELLEV